MDNLAPRIRDLLSRLSSRDELDPTSAPPPEPAGTESAYRHALRRWFELTAQEPSAAQAEVASLCQELVRLLDEIGEPRATALRRQWAREWWQETGVCPSCGEPGTYHEPDRRRGASQ